jgi:MerR family transcriptional regulator, thiopeptide resistance regulator
MDRGTDPSDPRVQELAKRWAGLIAEFTGGDRGIARSLSNLYQGEPTMRERAGMDPALADYVAKARASTGI